MIEAEKSSEKSVYLNQTKKSHIPEDRSFFFYFLICTLIIGWLGRPYSITCNSSWLKGKTSCTVAGLGIWNENNSDR